MVDCPFTNDFGGQVNPALINSNYCCFAAGTMISTASGEVAVEDLSEGELVATVDGSCAPIKWIGRRHLTLDYAPQPQPIRVSRSAFGPEMPSRDLVVSPEHAIYFETTLIPAAALVNGTTIAPVSMSHVTYYHLEFTKHTVVFAEGLPAETFLDTGLNVGFFSNSDVPTQLHFGQRFDAPLNARVRNWLKARISGIGTRVYNGFAYLGAKGLAQVALDFSLRAVQFMDGAYAPRASFGEAVERAREHVNARAACRESVVRQVA